MWVDKDRTSSTRKSLIRSLTWVLLFIVCNFSNLISVTRAVYQPDSSAYVITDVHFCCTSLFCAFMNTWPLLWHHCLRYVETDMHSWHISQCIYSIHMFIFAASSTYTMLPWSKYNRFDKISIRVGRWICEAWQRSTRYQGWTKRHQVARLNFLFLHESPFPMSVFQLPTLVMRASLKDLLMLQSPEIELPDVSCQTEGHTERGTLCNSIYCTVYSTVWVCGKNGKYSDYFVWCVGFNSTFCILLNY